jgi:single-strand DNA-binding protein
MPLGLATAPEPKEGAMDLNIVAITGRLAADPELHSTGNGTDVATLRIAVGRMKRQGEQRAGADFVDVVVWGEQAKHAGRYLAKGRRVAIKGRLQQRTWTTPEGANRSRLQVVADQVQFLDYKDRTGDDTSQVPDEREPETAPEAAAAEAPSPAHAEPASEAPADAPAKDAAPEASAPPAAEDPRRTSRRRKAASK